MKPSDRAKSFSKKHYYELSGKISCPHFFTIFAADGAAVPHLNLRQKENGMKYKDWLGEWLTLYVQPATKERTYKKYARQAQNHIIPYLGDYEPNELTVPVLQRFTANLTESGLAANTINGIIAVLKLSIKKAVSLGLADREYSSGIIGPKNREKKIECFTLQEQRKMETNILRSKDVKLFGVLFCLYTGLRIGELLALRWKDFDLIKGTVTVSNTCMDAWQSGRYVKILLPPKTENSNRLIPIPKQLLPIVKALKRASDCEYFICGKSKYGSQVRSYQKTFSRLLRNLQIPHKGFHALRHTFATRALECGMDVKTLSEILGHTDPAMTLKRYAHSMLEHKTDMMNKLGRLLQNEKPHKIK